MLKIYNTLTRRKEEFFPIKQGEVRMYLCGLTVYDYFHMGNARTLTVFDMVSRWLKSSAHNYKVKYVRNITDIDDKIIQRAAEKGEPIDALTHRMIAAMHDDMDRLKLERPTDEPRATDHVDRMVGMILALVNKGLAYPAANGDVYYAVHRFPGYGKLSGKSLNDLRAGERVGVEAAKRDPLDFVLWKAAKPGEPLWPSPWGPGRPGWHIECSAMSEAFLGTHFDIHGGGEDLQFPHHENEIAQSEGAHDHPFVNYWMHAAFLNMGNEKMSKSLGNFFTARDVLDQHKGHEEAVRFFLLRGHYRSQLSYTDDAVRAARRELDSFYLGLRETPPTDITIDWSAPYAARFKAAMDDDFNTWEAFKVLTELRREVNKTRSAAMAGLLKGLAGTLGLLQSESYLKGATPLTSNAPQIHTATGNLSAAGGKMAGDARQVQTATGDLSTSSVNNSSIRDEEVDALVVSRNTARAAREFAEADRIRKQLDEAGILLEDKSGGLTEWRRK